MGQVAAAEVGAGGAPTALGGSLGDARQVGGPGLPAARDDALGHVGDDAVHGDVRRRNGGMVGHGCSREVRSARDWRSGDGDARV